MAIANITEISAVKRVLVFITVVFQFLHQRGHIVVAVFGGFLEGAEADGFDDGGMLLSGTVTVTRMDLIYGPGLTVEQPPFSRT